MSTIERPDDHRTLPASTRLSLKTRWLIWKTRFSTPARLARGDEDKVVSKVTALNGGLAILALGLFAWLTDLPLIFPALGPSTFILFNTPLSKAGAPRSVVLGHLTAMLSGYAVWRSIGYLVGASVSLQAGGWPLVVSASAALGVTCLLLVRFSCPHPPACASALVVALGAVTNWLELLLMAVAVVLLAAQAVVLNRLAGVPVPPWSPRRLDDQ